MELVTALADIVGGIERIFDVHLRLREERKW